MNADLKSDLLRDDVLQAACSRRRKRQAGALAAVVLPIIGAFAFLHQPEVPKPEFVEIIEIIPKVKKSTVTTITTEEELLEHLAHLGPVITTREDGSRWLYLTEN